ncbi:MAG: hypothetical protein ABIQ39_03685 [Ilumatobacteraceae bacterium]
MLKRHIARGLCAVGIMLTLGGATFSLFGATTYASSTTDVTPGTTVAVHNMPYSTLGQGCDTGRNGYHFVMTGIEATGPIDASDFGPINITFSNGSHAVANFTDMTGPVAHFINTTINQSGNFTVTSATMTFPAASDVTGYTQFNLSHPPCGTVTAPTTTTIAPTTTTIAPTTTTIAPTTTSVDSEGPVPSSSTTSTVAPTSTVSPTPPSTGGSLPVTGNSGGTMAMLGLVLLGGGLTMLGLSRRPRVSKN